MTFLLPSVINTPKRNGEVLNKKSLMDLILLEFAYTCLMRCPRIAEQKLCVHDKNAVKVAPPISFRLV